MHDEGGLGTVVKMIESIENDTKKKQTYSPTILFLEQISMLCLYTCMLHGIPYTHHQSLFYIQYIISADLNSAAQNACAVLPRHML